MTIHDRWHEALSIQPQGDYDLVLFCGSFESRCHALAKLLRCKARKSHVLLTRDSPKERSNDDELPEAKLIEMVKERGSLDVHRVFLESPAKTWVTLHSFLGPAADAGQRILIDITVLPREIMGMIVAILGVGLIRTGRVTFGYVPAIAYDEDHQVEEVWLSRGVKDIRAVIGYEGRSGSKGAHLILMSGFELERAVAIVDRLEPTGVSLARTDQSGSTHPKFAAVQQGVAKALERFIPKAAGYVDVFPKSCARTYQSLSEYVSLLQSAGTPNIVIAPLNTKPSSLAAFLLASERSAIQVVYAEPQVYNTDHYSEAQDGYYEISFG